MSDPRPTRRRLAASWLLAFALAGLAAPALRGADVEPERLLAASDPFAAAPREMRVSLVFSAGASETRVPIELWLKGDALAMVRFLAPKDVGKFVVRRDGAFHVLSPTAKAPVKLARRWRRRAARRSTTCWRCGRRSTTRSWPPRRPAAW